MGEAAKKESRITYRAFSHEDYMGEYHAERVVEQFRKS